MDPTVKQNCLPVVRIFLRVPLFKLFKSFLNINYKIKYICIQMNLDWKKKPFEGLSTIRDEPLKSYYVLVWPYLPTG